MSTRVAVERPVSQISWSGDRLGIGELAFVVTGPDGRFGPCIGDPVIGCGDGLVFLQTKDRTVKTKAKDWTLRHPYPGERLILQAE